MLLLAVAVALPAWGQGLPSHAEPAAVVLRAQALTLAREIVGEANLREDARLQLQVLGAGIPELIESALLQALRERGIPAAVTDAYEVPDVLLRVLVLKQETSYDPVPEGGFRRTLATVVDVTLEDRAERQTRFLGQFDEMLADTVHRKEETVARDEKAPPAGSRPSAVEKVLAPLVVVAGAVIIVYLFFTVRS